MIPPKRTVLITGCSDGGMGAALAVAFHQAGLQVYATSRNSATMSHVKSLGIETFTLDILSESSIAACVSRLSSLDILVNNAGASYSMPISDLSIAESKKMFDANLWAQIAVTQAFLPLLLESKGMIVNQTSIVAHLTAPFQSVYNASKAAMLMITDCLRLELEPFGITVVDLRTGGVGTKMIQNQIKQTPTTLPKGSLYEPVREVVESTMRHDKMANAGMAPDKWAEAVVTDLLKKKSPRVIWKGAQATFTWITTFLPYGVMDGPFKKMSGLDVLGKAMQK